MTGRGQGDRNVARLGCPHVDGDRMLGPSQPCERLGRDGGSERGLQGCGYETASGEGSAPLPRAA